MEMGPELFHSVIGNECLPPTTLACTESNEGYYSECLGNGIWVHFIGL